MKAEKKKGYKVIRITPSQKKQIDEINDYYGMSTTDLFRYWVLSEWRAIRAEELHKSTKDTPETTIELR